MARSTAKGGNLTGPAVGGFADGRTIRALGPMVQIADDDVAHDGITSAAQAMSFKDQEVSVERYLWTDLNGSSSATGFWRHEGVSVDEALRRIVLRYGRAD